MESYLLCFWILAGIVFLFIFIRQIILIGNKAYRGAKSKLNFWLLFALDVVTLLSLVIVWLILPGVVK